MPHRVNTTTLPHRARASRRPIAVAPAVSVVVVNFRRRDETTSLVEQLERSEAFRDGHADIILVDNDADPRPLRRFAALHGGVSLCSLACNRGFSKAVNEGCKLAGGAWLLLLNPDVGVPDEFLDRVMESAQTISQRDPCVGAIGFELQHADGSAQPSSGPFPTLANVFAGLVRPRDRRRCRPPSPGAGEVPWATGCCLLIRRECWQELAGFDEDFFLYYEDVDLCRRARATGWTVWRDPGLKVTHYHPLHSRRVTPALRVITRHALLTYALKHWPDWQTQTLARIVSLEAGCRRLIAKWRSLPKAAAQYAALGAVARHVRLARAVRARAELLRTARALTNEP